LDATILRDAIVCTQYPEHQDTLWTIHHLATCTRDDGRLQDAEKLQRETLVIRRRILGPEHPDTLGSMEELAVILDMLHRYTEAAELYRKDDRGPAPHPRSGPPRDRQHQYNLACNAALSGRRDEALNLLRDALDHGLPSAEASGIEQDSDFKSLHGDPRFTALIADIQKRAVAPQAP